MVLNNAIAVWQYLNSCQIYGNSALRQHCACVVIKRSASFFSQLLINL